MSNSNFTQIVVVPDGKTNSKIPAVPGLLKYRKDTKELYIRANESWSVVAQQKKVSYHNVLSLMTA